MAYMRIRRFESTIIGHCHSWMIDYSSAPLWELQNLHENFLLFKKLSMTAANLCYLMISKCIYTYSYFDVLLTMHFSIFILVINQFDAQNFFFTISLFCSLYMFWAHVLIIRRSKLHYTASGRRLLSTCARDGLL